MPGPAGRILAKCFIFTIIMILAISCGMPRAVRYDGMQYTKSDRNNQAGGEQMQDEQQTGKDGPKNKIKEFEKKLLANKSKQDLDKNKISNTSGNYADTLESGISNPEGSNTIGIPAKRRLPTLREQMQMLTQEQTALNAKVDNMRKNMKDISSDVDEIKRILKGGREHGRNNEQVAGYGTKPAADKPSKKTAQYTIVSDEASGTEKKEPNPEPKKSTHEKSGSNDALSKSDNDKINDFKLAMNDFQNGNYTGTIEKLVIIAAAEDNNSVVADCNYWIGESHFNLEQYNEAIAHFIKVIKTKPNPRQDDAQAKLAESYVRTGRVDDARMAYRELMNKFPQSEYVPTARKMLQQL